MKHGKKPTVAQRKLMEKTHCDPSNWLVVKDTPEAMQLVHRHFDRRTKTIYKYRDGDDRTWHDGR